MKKIYIKPIDYLIIMDDNIKSIAFDNPILYRNFTLNITDNIIYSNNDIPENLDKKTLIIYNPFDLSINDPKIIKHLYKYIENEIKIECIDLLQNVEKSIFELVDNVAENTIIPIEYNLEVDVSKILQSIGVIYKISENYLENLVNYIKVYNQISNIDLIISLGLLNLLEENEVALLSKELSFMNIHLIDFDLNKVKSKDEIIIDKDWCVL